jgi:hypothetical protein
LVISEAIFEIKVVESETNIMRWKIIQEIVRFLPLPLEDHIRQIRRKGEETVLMTELDFVPYDKTFIRDLQEGGRDENC